MKKIKLKDICNISTGGTPSRSNINYWNNGDIPWCKIGDFSGKYINQVKENITEEGLKNSSAKIFKRGTILYTIFATIGEVAILEIESATNQAIAGLELINNEVDLEYLYYYLKSLKFVMLKKSRGVAQNNINLGILKNIEIKIPDKGEQINIAKILANIEKVIDKKNKQLKELNTIIKSQFVEMFGELKSSIKLGECCSINARIGWQSLTKKEHMKTGEYMLITGTDFKDNEIDYSNCVYVSKERYEMDKKIILDNDDILITKDGTIGKVAVVKNLEKPATLNSGIFVVRPNNIFNKEYIMYVFKGYIFKEFVNKAKTGATIKHLNQNKLINFEIPKPSMEEQIEFSNIYKQIDKQKFESMIQLEKENNDSINNIIKGTLEETTILYEVLLKKCFEKGK